MNHPMSFLTRTSWPIALLLWLAAGHVTAQSSQEVKKTDLVTGENWSYQRINLWNNQITERFRQDLQGGVGDHRSVLWTINFSQDGRRLGSVTREYLDATTLAFFDPKMEGRHIPLQFPLSPGKHWKFQYKYNPGSSRLTVEQAAVVEGWEDIKVPAGNFRTLKVVHTGYYHAIENASSWNGRIDEIYWYAPKAKRVVRMEYRDTTWDGSQWDHWRDELVEMNVSQPSERK
jgi:hypothetical protein